jgi:hypothetical protein
LIVSASKTPPSFVLDREACLGCAQKPSVLQPIVLISNPVLYTPSCIRKVIRKLDSGTLWGQLENSVGITCYNEDPAFFEMCGSLRDAANALSSSRANFEEEKLHVIAIARLLECTIITGDTSLSSSSMASISARFAVPIVSI